MPERPIISWPPRSTPEVCPSAPLTPAAIPPPPVAQARSLPRPDSSGRLGKPDAAHLSTRPVLHPFHPSYAGSPLLWAIHHLRFHPDPIQSQLLRSPAHYLILNCTCQWGKTTVIAIKTLHFALFHPRTTALVAAPSERQSVILLRRLQSFLKLLQITSGPVPGIPFSVRLPNSSEIIALPASADTIRGFTAHLLIFDEAARVPDSLYHALSPSRATTAGPLWLLSTPNGPNGFFYDAWHGSNDHFLNPASKSEAASDSERVSPNDTESASESEAASDSERVSPDDTEAASDSERVSPDDPHSPAWTRFRVPATDCPRITSEFLGHERLLLGDEMFRQEYLCEFVTPGGAFISIELLRSAVDPSITPLFPGPIFSNFLGDRP